ncbi:hypothetical protein MRX96_016569 [Rhipicephalus microplus]
MLRTSCAWHMRRRPSGDPRTKVGASNGIPATHKTDHGGLSQPETGQLFVVLRRTPHLRLSGKQRCVSRALFGGHRGCPTSVAANDDRWVSSHWAGRKVYPK